MPQAVIEAIAPLLAMLGVGTFTIIGMKIWLSAKTERLRLQANETGTAQLAEAVEELRDQMLSVRDEVAELHERMDFTERVLTKGAEQERRLPQSGTSA